MRTRRSPGDHYWSLLNAAQPQFRDRVDIDRRSRLSTVCRTRATVFPQAAGFLDRRGKGEARSELNGLTAATRRLASGKWAEGARIAVPSDRIPSVRAHSAHG